jgi:hypothetical protein
LAAPEEGLSSVSKCPIVLLVGVSLIKSKFLGSEKVKFAEVDFVMSRREKLRRDFTAYFSKSIFDINVGNAALD